MIFSFTTLIMIRSISKKKCKTRRIIGREGKKKKNYWDVTKTHLSVQWHFGIDKYGRERIHPKHLHLNLWRIVNLLFLLLLTQVIFYTCFSWCNFLVYWLTDVPVLKVDRVRERLQILRRIETPIIPCPYPKLTSKDCFTEPSILANEKLKDDFIILTGLGTRKPEKRFHKE